MTLNVDCPEIVARCKADRVDAAILVPNCPVCHQSVSLAARMLEENDISTVIMGCAKDIVEYVGVPRFLFSDFPLGNAAGRPRDRGSQAFTLDLALNLLESAPAPRTTVQSPLVWSAGPDWKQKGRTRRQSSADDHACRRVLTRRQTTPHPMAGFLLVTGQPSLIPFPQRAELKGAGLPEERKWRAVFSWRINVIR